MDTMLHLLASDPEAAEAVPEFARLVADKMPAFQFVLPELFLCLMVIVVLLVDLIRGKGPSPMFPRISLVGIVIAMLLVVFGDESLQIGYGAFAAMSVDGMARIFKLLFLATGAFAVLFVVRSGEKYGNEGELYVLLFGALAGMCYLASATDVISFYLAFETVSYTGFLMAGYKLDSTKGAEASGKYVIFGSVSSAVMLFGLTLIYGFTGSLELAVIAQALTNVTATPILMVGTIMVFSGFAFKAAAFPFHFWCPDVYEGAPAPIAAFLAVASKAAVFAVGLRVLGYGVGAAHDAPLGMLFAKHATFTHNMLIVAAIGSMTWGNLAALRQTNLQRMLAYSSVAHAGYLLMTCVVVGQGAAGDRAIAAILFYFFIYLCMTLAAFYVVTIMRRDTGTTETSALRGAGMRHPLLAVCFAIVLFSLTGLPPTAGFVGKFLLFAPVIEQQYFLLAIAGLVNGAVSLYYYAQPIMEMYLRPEDESADAPSRRFAPASADVALLLVLTVPLVIFGLFGWGAVNDAALEAVARLP